MTKNTKARLSTVYRRLDINFIRESIGYKGMNSVLRKRIASGNLSKKYIDAIISLRPHAKEVESVSDESAQSIVNFVEMIGYPKVSEYLGEDRTIFTIEMHSYLPYSSRSMSIHRYNYIKNCLNKYCVKMLDRANEL